MGEKRYHDADWLRQMYHDEHLTLREIAERCNVSYTTINKWVNRHGISTRAPEESRELRGTGDNQFDGGVHHNSEWLYERYYGDNMTISEMADAAGVGDASIIRQMDRRGIERRPNYVTRVLRNPGAGFVQADARGYEMIKHSVKDHTYNFPIHRLLAIAEYGYEVVKGAVVHHKNGIKWDNRPDNIELFDSQAEHMKHHGEERGGLNK
jgi:predicted DNA-binding protein YlxM (UPF0122 family)